MDTCQHRPVKTKDVRILVRPQSNSAPLEQVGAQLVSGDLKDPLSLERACAGADRVITTANSALRGGDDTVETVDRQGNRSLIDAAKAANVQQFVFVSAYGATLDSPVPFLRAKAETEASLRASGCHTPSLHRTGQLCERAVGSAAYPGWRRDGRPYDF
jgi:NADH dehydrogenase